MFSKGVKSEIKERAGCKSELSGEDDRPLHCSHFNHDKDNPEKYNDKGMGFLITDIEHYEYHLRFRKNPKRIGLTRKENVRALKELTKRIYSSDSSSVEEIANKTLEARQRWDEFFEERDYIPESPNSRESIPPLAV